MSRLHPYLVITIDDEHGVALVRGEPGEVRRVCQLLGADPTWSISGRGYVVHADLVADLVAYCQSIHELAVIGKRKPDIATSDDKVDKPKLPGRSDKADKPTCDGDPSSAPGGAA